MIFLLIFPAAGALFFINARSSEFTASLVEAIGIGLIAAAILGRLWSTLYIGGRKTRELVEAGPYSITRNPLYVFSAMGATGAGAQTGSVMVAVAFAVCTWLIFHFVIRAEEVRLHQAFGASYENYCSRVPRFLPRFSAFADVDCVVANPKRLYAVFFDGLLFFSAVPVSELIEWLQARGTVPALVQLF
ncbi:isoprenylcysteine carboxylmethyltransferase family protein [Mesorhizobium sp. 1M-11]|uniref:methyltransferase family protein n=1 Tax=Mesorhizobium sp. 1M-11 TaxID=1529006 RepID=UPI0006C7583A|nr:isoprenylcysteine carboxylmethyltransferase family protein [Mesorhizobium sp. 1M-11]